MSCTSKPRDERSLEHPFVTLVTSVARVWFEHADLEHIPVNQVLIEGTADLSEPLRNIGTSPAAFKH
jgi:hypothetical protein